jgi:GDP-L-fucose synthase
VLPALIRKFHEGKINQLSEVEVWGTGSPLREFLHVDDLADACYFLMQQYNEKEFVNVGTGTDLSIKALAEMVKDIVGFEGELVWNTSKPDGTPRKLMNVNKIESLGWKHQIDLRSGIEKVYIEFVQKYNA